jgi:hypothetical protein
MRRPRGQAVFVPLVQACPSGLGQRNCCIYCLYRIIFGCPTHFVQKKITRSFVFNNLQPQKGKVPWDKSHRSGKYSYFFLPIGQFRKSYLLCLLDLYYFFCVSHAFCPNCATLYTVHTAQFLIRSSFIIHSASCQRSSACPQSFDRTRQTSIFSHALHGLSRFLSMQHHRGRRLPAV